MSKEELLELSEQDVIRFLIDNDVYLITESNIDDELNDWFQYDYMTCPDSTFVNTVNLLKDEPYFKEGAEYYIMDKDYNYPHVEYYDCDLEHIINYCEEQGYITFEKGVCGMYNKEYLLRFISKLKESDRVTIYNESWDYYGWIDGYIYNMDEIAEDYCDDIHGLLSRIDYDRFRYSDNYYYINNYGNIVSDDFPTDGFDWDNFVDLFLDAYDKHKTTYAFEKFTELLEKGE